MTRSWLTRLADLRSHRAPRVTAAIVACGLAAAGVARATIPDSNGVLHGCYMKSGGAIRIIDASVTTCKSSETAISWNVTGPAGPTGNTGDPGPTGPRGPSEAFLKDQRRSFGSVALDGTDLHDLVTLSLPPGSYVVNATAALAGTTTSAIAQCFIRGASGTFYSSAATGMLGGTANSFLTLPLTTAFTLDSGDDVSLACRSAGPASSQPSTITAIQVETLTTQ